MGELVLLLWLGNLALRWIQYVIKNSNNNSMFHFSRTTFAMSCHHPYLWSSKMCWLTYMKKKIRHWNKKFRNYSECSWTRPGRKDYLRWHPNNTWQVDQATTWGTAQCIISRIAFAETLTLTPRWKSKMRACSTTIESLISCTSSTLEKDRCWRR